MHVQVECLYRVLNPICDPLYFSYLFREHNLCGLSIKQAAHV